MRLCWLAANRILRVRSGTHYPHVMWARVMLRVQLGCERRINIEFCGAFSHFCHSAYVTWSPVERWSAHVPARLIFLLSHTFRETWYTLELKGLFHEHSDKCKLVTTLDNIQGVFIKRPNFCYKDFILQHFKHCPLQCSPLYWRNTVPNVSSIVGMLPDTHFLWWRAVLLSHFPESPRFQKQTELFK
jgi:hypothetical protein